MEQEIQNVGNTLESMVDTYQQYFENFLPGLAGFGIKVVICSSGLRRWKKSDPVDRLSDQDVHAEDFYR